MRPPVEDPELCRQWFERLWLDACALRARYRLPLRRGWWQNPVQVEALAALAAWVERYDSAEWDDPPGKLALLYDLERVAALLRDGSEPFQPDRDVGAFRLYLHTVGWDASEQTSEFRLQTEIQQATQPQVPEV